jgi:hypothetical protein
VPFLPRSSTVWGPVRCASRRRNIGHRTLRMLRDADGAPREGKPLLDLSGWAADERIVL